jgi:hypothetical protein
MMNMFQSSAHAEQALRRYEQESGCTLASSGKEVFEFASRGNFGVKVHRNESIRLMLELSPEFASVFSKLDWVVLHRAEGDSFVTSDNPLVLTRPADRKDGPLGGVRGILTPGCDKIVSLGSTTCLIMQGPGEGVTHLDAT